MADGPTETAAKTNWSLPARHGFEDWSDARAYDGTVTLLQPQARPLYDGISPHYLLALFAAPEEANSRDVVRQTHGHAGGARMFWSFYFVATALHALHMIVGVGLVGWIALQARRFCRRLVDAG